MRTSVMYMYRYPVKGLSAEPLQQVTLKPYDCVPHDRRFALAHATTKFDVDRPEWMAKTKLIMLMRDEKLALLQTRFEEQSGVLTIKRNGEPLLAARFPGPRGPAAVDQFLANFLGSSVSGTPQLIEAPGIRFRTQNRSRMRGVTSTSQSLTSPASEPWRRLLERLSIQYGFARMSISMGWRHGPRI